MSDQPQTEIAQPCQHTNGISFSRCPDCGLHIADWGLLSTPSATRVHNHPPYRPNCNERESAGQLRGACLNDDGSDR